MKSQEIRKRFLDFFKQRDHTVVESSSLIPGNDPTLLFTNAGMNQFKDYFTGNVVPDFLRATSAQKCVRAGGKHNDLENVGFTARHHTFFEMLGNFSFGDYFKHEAIRMAWHFLTQELSIPKSKLYVTVHHTDQEAADIWAEQEGVPRERIFFLGDKDNFWEMGDLGPCGPSSEIFYDHGEEFSDGSDTTQCILNDEGRYVEIWNLVFMQFEKFNQDGKIQRRKLPKPSVDTGAGLERIAALMQGKYWNYDSDAFTPILNAIAKLTGKSYSDEKYTSSFRVIADHIRSTVMLVTDGVIPSNEGRGYVLRRIIRRAVRHLEELEVQKTSFYKLVPVVFESLGDIYSQNQVNQPLATKYLKLEEDKFRKTLKNGLELIQKEIEKLPSGAKFSGQEAFKLYDTYGFPLDLTEVILKEKAIELDHEGFESSMEKQKKKSRSGNQFSQSEDDLSEFFNLKNEVGTTEFLGHETLETRSKLIKAIPLENGKSALFFHRTPFYSESGGQGGDCGSILKDGSPVARVIDTQFIVDGLIAHICLDFKAQTVKEGEELLLKVDRFKREETAKHHSATHLLQASLIEILGDHVKQAGSSNSSSRLRFDFTHPDTISAEQLLRVEILVNQKINEDLEVNTSFMSKEQATKEGAIALFGEKYDSRVRVLKMGDFSVELCGGTHVDRTSRLGIFKIVSESSLASGIRRIEAVVSKAASDYLLTRSTHLKNIESELGVKADQVLSKIISLQADLKEKNKKIRILEDQLQSGAVDDLFKNPIKLKDGKSFFITEVKELEPKELRSLSDKFKDKHPNDIALIYLKEHEKVSYLLRTTKAGPNASELLKANQAVINGRGGGKPDLAQGSGEAKNFDQFLNTLKASLQ